MPPRSPLPSPEKKITASSLNNVTAFTKEIYEQVKKIPSGRVATYGQIAFLAGRPGASRAVGWALHHNPEPGVIPCHRVVFKDGRVTDGFAFGGPEAQRMLLEMEGVEFEPDGRIDMTRYSYTLEGTI